MINKQETEATWEELQGKLEEYGVSMQQLEKLYPRLYAPLMFLSVTGIPARIYNHWRKSGLINGPEQEEGKGWMKINLIDYVWLKVIETMREIGMPFDTIREVKELMFSNYLEEIVKNKDEYIKLMREESTVDKKRISFFDEVITKFQKEWEHYPDEFKVYHSLLGGMIIQILIQKDKGYITIAKEGDKYKVGFFSIKVLKDFSKHIQLLADVPCTYIPIRSLIEKFLEEDDTEEYATSINLLDLKEQKVIEAMRKKDFQQITIKQDDKKQSISIDVERDGDILHDKAKEIKRMFGLNEYSEVTIIYRNDKHLYFKNKTRL